MVIAFCLFKKHIRRFSGREPINDLEETLSPSPPAQTFMIVWAYITSSRPEESRFRWTINQGQFSVKLHSFFFSKLSCCFPPFSCSGVSPLVFAIMNKRDYGRSIVHTAVVNTVCTWHSQQNMSAYSAPGQADSHVSSTIVYLVLYPTWLFVNTIALSKC